MAGDRLCGSVRNIKSLSSLALFWFFFSKKCSLAGLSKYANQLFTLFFSVQILAFVCMSLTADFYFVLGCFSDTCEVCLGLPPCSAVFPARRSCCQVCLTCAHQLHRLCNLEGKNPVLFASQSLRAFLAQHSHGRRWALYLSQSRGCTAWFRGGECIPFVTGSCAGCQFVTEQGSQCWCSSLI